MARLILLALVLLLVPRVAEAYIGPGAGFAFLGSGAVIFAAIGLALLTIIAWPFQAAVRRLRGHGVRGKYRRVIVVGLDGMEPSIVEPLMAQGKLPNFSRLVAAGSASRVQTTLPALSPVAWSTFQTGVNPGAHNVFDFLTRDRRTLLPLLASVSSTQPPKSTRGSKPFWDILAERGIVSHALRIPITYPPQKTRGTVLSAMCTPDLRGSQGTFTLLVDNEGDESAGTGGVRVPLRREDGRFVGELAGPPAERSGEFVTIPVRITRVSESSAEISLGATTVTVHRGEFTPWVRVMFPLGQEQVPGLVRLLLRKGAPHPELYISPVNIDPEEPALPISAPPSFAPWLSRTIGPFGTLGLMEDTWARNEYALSDHEFLTQSYLTHQEREAMFFEMLQRTNEGFLGCVFDAPDRIQHMFWRFLDQRHPAPKESGGEGVIHEMYHRMDTLVGRVLEARREHDLIIVMSDHGFSSFRRCCNLNSALRDAGFLSLKEGRTSPNYLANVAWDRTSAFALGLSGIYLNVAGRERDGIVAPEDRERVADAIATKLLALRDPLTGEAPIRRVYRSARAYRGIYVEEAPDLIIGWQPGYRVSWDATTGGVEDGVFSDNVKAWSGDHHIDPELVPGVLLSSERLRGDASLLDLAPTVLEALGAPRPRYLEGRSLLGI